MRTIRAGVGLAAVFILVFAGSSAWADMLTYSNGDVNGSTGTLLLSNFVTANGRTAVPLGDPPWVQAEFSGTVGSNTFTLTLTTLNWGASYSTAYVADWGFMSTIPSSDFSLPNNFLSSMGLDTAGTFTFIFRTSNATILPEKTTQMYTFTLTGATYDPKEFDLTSAGPTNQAYSMAIFYESNNTNFDYYAADLPVPEPSRLVGLLGMAMMGGAGLCVGLAKKRSAGGW